MQKKLVYLDGMRALMAFNVILCHFVCVYYPEMYWGGQPPLSLVAHTPLSVLVNGSIAVTFFFVLSGFLIGMSVFTKETRLIDVAKKSYARYTRLLPVIFSATLIAFLLMKFNLLQHLKITARSANLKFLSEYCNFEPSLRSLFYDSFIGVFINVNRYIGPFWTIRYELWGYIITLTVATIIKKSKWRRIAYFLSAVLVGPCLESYYSLFFMGLFLADLMFNNRPTVLERLYHKFLTKKPTLICASLLSLYFSCCPTQHSNLYSFWFKIPGSNAILLRGLGISLFLFVATNSPLIQKMLRVKPLVFLGNVSFETYAIHWPIMLSCEAGLFIFLEKHMTYDAAAVLAFVATIPLIYISSFVLNIILKKIALLFRKRSQRNSQQV